MSDSVHAALGSVVSLWRYPVKSMMGEELNAAEVTVYVNQMLRGSIIVRFVALGRLAPRGA